MKLFTKPLLLSIGIFVLACTPQEMEEQASPELNVMNPTLLDTGDDTDTHPDNRKDG